MRAAIGQIIRSHGRRFIVEAEGQTYGCSTRGKRVDFACGDRVEILIQNKEQAVIEESLPRSSLLYRQDEWKTKVIAANVSRILFVIAAVPSPSEELLNRCLIAAEAADIDPVILINKADLPETAALVASCSLCRTGLQDDHPVSQTGHEPAATAAGWRNLRVCRPVRHGQIHPHQCPAARSQCPHRRYFRGAGFRPAHHHARHAVPPDRTIRRQRPDRLPGLQEFGLKHLQASDLLHYFPEMRPLIGQCRFHNCTHRKEPDCAIKQAAADGKISPQRLDLLQRLSNELLNQTA
jgi:ribosome biogenesis GTPase